MTKSFEILPHTADVRLKVFGKTKEELFKNAVLGMAEILKSTSKTDFEYRSPSSNLIKIQSPDINSLLVDFLSEVLYQSQINKTIYRETKFFKFGDSPSTSSGQAELEAKISGIKIDEFDEDIKAVTYHELDIKKIPAGGFFETIIVFDV